MSNIIRLFIVQDALLSVCLSVTRWVVVWLHVLRVVTAETCNWASPFKRNTRSWSNPQEMSTRVRELSFSVKINIPRPRLFCVLELSLPVMNASLLHSHGFYWLIKQSNAWLFLSHEITTKLTCNWSSNIHRNDKEDTVARTRSKCTQLTSLHRTNTRYMHCSTVRQYRPARQAIWVVQVTLVARNECGCVTVRELFEGGVNFLQLKRVFACEVNSWARKSQGIL